MHMREAGMHKKTPVALGGWATRPAMRRWFLGRVLKSLPTQQEVGFPGEQASVTSYVPAARCNV